MTMKIGRIETFFVPPSHYKLLQSVEQEAQARASLDGKENDMGLLGGDR